MKKIAEIRSEMRALQEANEINRSVGVGFAFLTEIAEKNKTSWVIKYTPYRDFGPVEWEVEVLEPSEQRIVIQAYGVDPADALTVALRDLSSALENFEYWCPPQ